MKYFDLFPKLDYDLNKNGTTIQATNLMVRFKFLDIILKTRVIINDYLVRDGERPDIVSDKVYGRDDLGWIILLTNLVRDPYYEWPMDQRDFINYIKHKYGSFHNAAQTDFAYYWIIQHETRLYDGTIIHERTLRVDETTYLDLVAEDRKKLTNLAYEIEENEKKRSIRIIEPYHIPQIIEEAKLVLGSNF